jgi:hypothetical protein
MPTQRVDGMLNGPRGRNVCACATSIDWQAVAKLAELDASDDLSAEQLARKKAVVQAAIDRARARRATTPSPDPTA